jgi:hypothetical protein
MTLEPADSAGPYERDASTLVDASEQHRCPDTRHLAEHPGDRGVE